MSVLRRWIEYRCRAKICCAIAIPCKRDDGTADVQCGIACDNSAVGGDAAEGEDGRRLTIYDRIVLGNDRARDLFAVTPGYRRTAEFIRRGRLRPIRDIGRAAVGHEKYRVVSHAAGALLMHEGRGRSDTVARIARRDGRRDVHSISPHAIGIGRRRGLAEGVIGHGIVYEIEADGQVARGTFVGLIDLDVELIGKGRINQGATGGRLVRRFVYRALEIRPLHVRDGGEGTIGGVLDDLPRRDALIGKQGIRGKRRVLRGKRDVALRTKVELTGRKGLIDNGIGIVRIRHDLTYELIGLSAGDLGDDLLLQEIGVLDLGCAGDDTRATTSR